MYYKKSEIDTMKSILFICIVLLIPQEFVSGCFLTKKQRVYVLNKLPSNSPLLRVHCASGDNDLGYHMLHRNDEFSWSFCDSLSTLFFCHLWWGSKNVAFVAYKFSFGADYDRVQTYWRTTEAGVIFEDNIGHVGQYNWKNN